MTLVAEIGDISRFPTARKLCAGAGLTPQVRNSDRKVRHGHITKQGSRWIRWILQEAAQTAKRPPMFADTYGQLAHRRGANIATVAIARRLLARSFHSLTQREQASISEKALPGALASLHAPAPRPPVLTEQPGSGLHRHADPTDRGPNGCRRATSATSSRPSHPLISPAANTTSSPTQGPAGGPALPRPLTRPDPMGAMLARREGFEPPTARSVVWGRPESQRRPGKAAQVRRGPPLR